MENINLNAIENVINFLVENEQYGDDWSEEIVELRKVADIFYEDYMNRIADELQEFVLTAGDDAIEDFCGFPLDGISKEDAVYQVMTQMPDEVLLEYHKKFIG